MEKNYLKRRRSLALPESATRSSDRTGNGGFQWSGMAMTWTCGIPANLLVHIHSGHKRLCSQVKIYCSVWDLSKQVHLSEGSQDSNCQKKGNRSKALAEHQTISQRQVRAILKAFSAESVERGGKTACQVVCAWEWQLKKKQEQWNIQQSGATNETRGDSS